MKGSGIATPFFVCIFGMQQQIGQNASASKPELRAIAGQAVLFQHLLQDLDITCDVHGIGAEELIQLFFKSLYHFIHHFFDAMHGGCDVFTLDTLCFQLRVGTENF